MTQRIPKFRDALVVGAIVLTTFCTQALAGPASNEQPFANLSTQYFENLDGVAFLGATDGVYTAKAASKSWTFYQYAGDPRGQGQIVAVAGGSAEHPLIVAEGPGKNRRLLLLGAAVRPKIIKEFSSALGGSGSFNFASDSLGCGWLGGSLYITIDGGHRWTSKQLIFSNGEAIRCVRWISKSELVVGGQDGHLCLISVVAGTLKNSWTYHLDGPIVEIRSFGPNLLVLSDHLSLVGINPPKKLMSLSDLGPIDGFESAGDDLYAYGSEHLDVVGWDGVKFKELFTAAVPLVDAIFAKMRPVLIVAYITDGAAQCLTLSDRKLVPTETQIHLAGLPKEAVATTQKDYPSDEELKDALEWGGKLDDDTAEKIFHEAAEMKNLSPRQQILWARDKCKQLVESGQHLKKQ